MAFWKSYSIKPSGMSTVLSAKMVYAYADEREIAQMHLSLCLNCCTEG